jgi:hypothetical protein
MMLDFNDTAFNDSHSSFNDPLLDQSSICQFIKFSIMRVTFSSTAALGGMLLSLAHADDDPVLHLQAFRNPDCATATNMQPTEKDYQFAIYGIRDLLGGMDSDVSTCVEVSSFGGCAISLCDANSPRTTMGYAAIATAAQQIHAHCKGD